MINWIKTAELHNITIIELKSRFKRFPNSKKKVIAICDVCGIERILDYRDSFKICKTCSTSGENNPMYGKHHTDRSKKMMSDKQTGENSYFYGLTGRNHPLWKGGKQKFYCETCGCITWKYPSECRNEHKFCSHECQYKYEGFNTSNTDIEILMQDILIKRGYSFTTQEKISHYYPDILLTDYNIIVECDGEYWHGSDEMLKRDEMRDKILNKEGYIVVRFWGKEIKNDIEACIQKLEVIINNIRS